MRFAAAAIITSVAIASLSGCALTTDRIDLQYTPQSAVAKVPGADKVSVQVQVIDQRGDRSNKVGAKKNGFGAEMAPILATEDVATTVRRAIEGELKSRGFQLGADTAQVQLLTDLLRFYNDHKNGFFAGDAVAELNLTVNVKSRKGDVLFSRQVMAQGLEPNIQLASGENAKLALNRALDNGMKQLFEDQGFLTALVKSSEGKAAGQ